MAEILIGMGGWQLPPFEKSFYPVSVPRGFRRLAYYSQFFDMVEVNATFYTTALTRGHARQWLRDVGANPRFVFTVKAYHGFTHTMNATPRDFSAMQRLLEPLAESGRLGGVVMQFPVSFKKSQKNCAQLERLSSLFQGYVRFVELRHVSWNRPETYRFLKGAGLHLINVDLPKLKSHMPLTTVAWEGVAYFRMMGRNASTWYEDKAGDRYHYRYSPAELEELVKKVKHAASSSQRTFVVFHNDPEANSPVNGFQVRHLLENERVKVPPTLLRKFPALSPIARTEEEPATLFTRAVTLRRV